MILKFQLRKTVGNAVTICPDVCLCEYTSHGHCGIVEGAEVENDSTLGFLQQTAVCYAQAGADVISLPYHLGLGGATFSWLGAARWCDGENAGVIFSRLELPMPTCRMPEAKLPSACPEDRGRVGASIGSFVLSCEDFPDFVF